MQQVPNHEHNLIQDTENCPWYFQKPYHPLPLKCWPTKSGLYFYAGSNNDPQQGSTILLSEQLQYVHKQA
jgi:hypothetical protein